MTIPVKPRHREGFTRICPRCGSEMWQYRQDGGTYYVCKIERCGHTVDVPYGALVPPLGGTGVQR